MHTSSPPVVLERIMIGVDIAMALMIVALAGCLYFFEQSGQNAAVHVAAQVLLLASISLDIRRRVRLLHVMKGSHRAHQWRKIRTRRESS